MITSSENFNITISRYRKNAQLNEAIQECKKAILKYPENNFYYKVLGDIYFQNGEDVESLESYIDYLAKIQDRYELFKVFTKYFKRFELRKNNNIAQEKYYIQKKIENDHFSVVVAGWLSEFLNLENKESSQVGKIIELSNRNDPNFIKSVKDLERNNKTYELMKVIDYTINRKNREQCNHNDKFMLSIIEKNEMYYDALKITRELLEIDKDPILVRTLFRICRKINNYAEAEKLMREKKALFDNINFNIEFELFYYYKKIDNRNELYECLNKIYLIGNNSIPICKTLYNFYLQIGMVEDALKLEQRITDLKTTKKSRKVNNKYDELLQESERDVIPAMMAIISESEHNRQLSALRELLKGFKHELGQPVTNIRYAIQLHEMKKEHGKASLEETEALLAKIIKQTDRLGNLLERFSPIVSPKSEFQNFEISDRFNIAINDLRERLTEIKVNIIGTEAIIFGDPVQFDQIVYNILLNSMQSIKQKGNEGRIDIMLKEDAKYIYLNVLDNGLGIPEEYHKKIFQPFFTTKDPTKGEGGEGLGMYIVWNLVRMFNGDIKVDSRYVDGASLKIKFRKENKNDGKI